MDCAIFIRMRSGAIVPVTDPDGEMKVYSNIDEAIADADNVSLIAAGYPYQIVEFDAL